MEADFRLSRHAEFDLGQDEVVAIARLLHASFEDYPVDKIYFPQPPHVRVLGWEKNQLVGHVAGVIREVLVGDHHMVILGVADLCVEADRLRQKIATVLVQQLEAIADKRGIFSGGSVRREGFFSGDRISGARRQMYLAGLSER
ncbi:MAG: GNAT family N-acetyltransferase [Saprospiraceae bacterium]|nr:GNAT family N-acetyltransferase [Saprospiraceae bacterium]